MEGGRARRNDGCSNGSALRCEGGGSVYGGLRAMKTASSYWWASLPSILVQGSLRHSLRRVHNCSGCGWEKT